MSLTVPDEFCLFEIFQKRCRLNNLRPSKVLKVIDSVNGPMSFRKDCKDYGQCRFQGRECKCIEFTIKTLRAFHDV